MSLQVDMTALKQMGENDLKELGIPMVIIYTSICGICSGVVQWGLQFKLNSTPNIWVKALLYYVCLRHDVA